MLFAICLSHIEVEIYKSIDFIFVELTELILEPFKRCIDSWKAVFINKFLFTFLVPPTLKTI